MIHATQLNSHASSLRGEDISMSSSEGMLQELDKLYPSKFAKIYLQRKQSLIPQSIPYWICQTSNSEPGTSTKAPHHGALWPETSGEVPQRPNQNVKHFSSKENQSHWKKHQSTSKQILCLVSILVFLWILSWIPHGVSHGKKGHPCRHDRLRQIGDSQGQDLLEICWLWNHLLKIWISGNNWNIEICWNMVWNGSKYMLKMEIIVDVWIIGIIGLSTVTIHKFSSRHLLHRASYSFRGGEFHDSLLHRAWKLMNLYTIHWCLGRWQNSSLVADVCEFTFAQSW